MEPPPELVDGLKTGLAYMIGAPAIGIVGGTTIGAIAWKDHRVIGGLIGLFGGGILGGIVGSMLAKSAIESRVLPSLEKLAVEQGTISASDIGSGSGMIASADSSRSDFVSSSDPVPNSAGPLTGFHVPIETALPAISRALGVPSNSTVGRAVTAAVQATSTKSPESAQRVVVRLAASPTTQSQKVIPTLVARGATLPPFMEGSLPKTSASATTLPRIPSLPIKPPTTTALPRIPSLPIKPPTTTSIPNDPSRGTTTVLPGQTMAAPLIR